MTTESKNRMRAIMNLAWQFVKRNGFDLSQALKTAWVNVKLHTALKKGIVKFYFTKVDGSLREAYGTLKESLLPETKGTGRKPSDTVQVYYDTEKQEYRCYKKANLVKMA